MADNEGIFRDARHKGYLCRDGAGIIWHGILLSPEAGSGWADCGKKEFAKGNTANWL